MRKASKILVTIIVLTGIAALASLGITALWNNVVTAACGFASITFLQGLGLFLLGQLMSSGFIIALLAAVGSIHGIMHHAHGNRHNHWRNMTDEERLEFIRRRREHFGNFNHSHSPANDAQK